MKFDRLRNILVADRETLFNYNAEKHWTGSTNKELERKKKNMNTEIETILAVGCLASTFRAQQEVWRERG